MKEIEKKDMSILLIDCSNLSYAALHSIGYLSYNEKETGIIYGFLRQILSLAIRFKTNRFVFCWDAGMTHRHLMYPEYKRKRHDARKDDPEKQAAHKSLMLQNHELIHHTLPTLGFKNNFVKLWYEADDLLAYWANKLKNDKIIMVTSDADLYQCLDHCDIWRPQQKAMMTKKIFKETFKIKPSQWALAKAIGGCSGDNVQGIQGAADPKSTTSKALKYIQGKLKDGKIKERIESKEGQKIIERNLPLVTCPCRPELLKRMLLRKDEFSSKKFVELFDKFRFDSFLNKKNFKQWKKTFLNEEK